MQIKHRIFFYEIKPIFVADHKKYFLQHTKKLKSKNFHCLWFQKFLLFYLRKNISHCLWFEKSFLFYLKKKIFFIVFVSKIGTYLIWGKIFFIIFVSNIFLLFFLVKCIFYCLCIKHFTHISFGKKIHFVCLQGWD